MLALPDIDKLVIDSPQLGCVLYVPGLPGGSNKVHDRSPYSNAGTITGATWKQLPSGLWYLSFDAVDDDVDCGYDTSLRVGSGDFVVSFWFKIVTQQDAWDVLLHVGGGSTGGKRYAVVSPPSSSYADQLQFQMDDDSNPCFVNITFTGWGAWHKVTCVRDGSTARTYVDDALTETGDSSSTGSLNSPNNRPCTIGCNTDEATGTKGNRALASIALLTIVKGRTWSALDVQNCFNQEKHLFGVWQI